MKFVAMFLVLIGVAHADLKLPAVISDHMVLQANTEVAIWGWSDQSDTIEVSFGDQNKRALVDEDGRWQVMLDAMPPSSMPRDLVVRSRRPDSKDKHFQCSDVLVGEVWLAAGQSNMEMKVYDKQHGIVDHAEQEIAAAKHPEIRLFVHDAPFSIYEIAIPPDVPLKDRPGKWTVCSPSTVSEFSAIAYFFARDLQVELGVPVGIVSASVGGTPIEAWTSIAPQKNNPLLKPLLDDWNNRIGDFDPQEVQRNYAIKKKEWLMQRAEALKKGEPTPKAPTAFKNLRVMSPGSLFNGVIAPLIPYAIQGCIWYQGERNAAGPFTGLYGEQLKLLIDDWRTHWGTPFYFAWVQLPGFQKPQRMPSESNGWGVAVREGQLQSLSVARTGMAITIDLGGENAGHPTNKLDFATRLSNVVLYDVYGKRPNSGSGPIWRAAERQGNQMVLSFDFAEGIKASSGDLQGFAIAGSDRIFVWAKTKIENEKVVVWSDAVPEPVAVRYGWAGNPPCNLVNAFGIPASPFRTDIWK